MNAGLGVVVIAVCPGSRNVPVKGAVSVQSGNGCGRWCKDNGGGDHERDDEHHARHDVLRRVIWNPFCPIPLGASVQALTGHQRQVQRRADPRLGRHHGRDRVDDAHGGGEHAGVVVVAVGAAQAEVEERSTARR